MEVDKGDFPNAAAIAEGDEFSVEVPDGEEVLVRVVEVKDDAVIVDANHPLAGMTLHYAVKVRSVRVATDEEIASAAADFDEAGEHVHGAECAHGHGHEAEGELVTLGKKKQSTN